MADKVPGGVKEEIARTVVASVVKQCADYSSRNAGRTIEVALYKFDEEQQQLVPFSAPNAFATDKINLLIPNGGTNIGDAILAVKKDLDRTGLSSKHIVVITDGENTGGATPDEVAVAMQKNPQKPSVYMVAFDVNSSVFSGVKQSGWMVYSASDAKELQQTLDQIFGENILLERQ
jgi:Mg-chelatase subunit ChlD